jgi:hypothetical protein
MSVCSDGTARLSLNGFSQNLTPCVFQNSVKKIQVKSDKNNKHFLWRCERFYIISRWILIRISISDKTVEKIKIHILCPITILPFVRLWGKIWSSQAGHRQQFNMAHERCMLHNRLQTHTHDIQYLLLSLGKNGYANAPQCYVIRPSPLWFCQNIPSIMACNVNWHCDCIFYRKSYNIYKWIYGNYSYGENFSNFKLIF